MTVIDLVPLELRPVLRELPREEGMGLAREFLEASDEARAEVLSLLEAGLLLVGDE